MRNKRKGIWILITITVILLIANPKTIKYLKVKTSLNQGQFSIIKEIEIPHSNQIIYKKLDKGLIKYWEGILIYYNMAGEQLWSLNLGINRPTIKTNSDSIYIMDKHTNQIYRFNKKGEQIYKSTLDKNYKNFNICHNNYVILHHGTEDVVEYVTTINEEGKKISEIAIGEGKVTNIAISKDYDRIAVSTVGVKGDKLENNLLTYDLKANLISSENFKDNIILYIFFNEKGDLIVLDEINIYSINKENLIKWQTDFNDPIIFTNTKDKDSITIYSKATSKNSIIYSQRENTIKTLSYTGKLLSEIKPKEEIINIDSYKNNIIAYSLRTILKYNKNGDLKIEYPYTSDILKSFILSDNNIVIITKEKITFLELKRG